MGGGDGRREGGDQESRLLHVRAAQLRARAVRSGLVKIGLGTLFLIGAFAHAFAPDRNSSNTVTWMAALVVLSSFHLGLGLRTLARTRRGAGRLWLPLTLAWGILAAIALRLLQLR